MKIDAHTGITSLFIAYGSTNLPSTSTLTAMPTNPTIGANPGLVIFDSNRNMYVMASSTNRTSASAEIYQINLNTNKARLYVGGSGATGYTASATPTTVYVDATDFEFDESNNLYFFTTCSPGYTWGTQNVETNLMRLTQNTDGSAGTLSTVAGNCTKGNPVSGTTATSTPVSNGGDNLFYSLSVWGNGANIYYSDDSGGTYKVLGTTSTAPGTLYSTAIPAAEGLIYSASANQIYIVPGATNNSITAYSVSLTGASGESLVSTVVGSGGTGACNVDGASASATCGALYGGLALNEQGQLFFGAGGVNAPTRIRYVDNTGLMRTYAGTFPFYGGTGSLNKSLMRGTFTGIYFKQETEANQTAYPTGLYFYEATGPVIGYINDSSGLVSTLVGSQTGVAAPLYTTGTALSANSTLGVNAGGAGAVMTFDSSGLPWFSYDSASNVVIASIDANSKAIAEQKGGAFWDYATDGTSPVNTVAYDTVSTNLQIKGDGAFLLNRFYSTPSYTSQAPFMRFLDFSGSTLGTVSMLDIMGGTGTTTSADTTTPGSLASLSLSSACDVNGCKIQYIAAGAANPANDLLYFTEGSKLRVITDPTTPASNLLTTVFTAATTISNFILSLDQSQAFYTMSGRLYCHTLTGTAKSWCNDTSLGPPTGMNTIGTGGNQFTWKNSSALIISDYYGDIYEYDLLP